MLLSPGHMASSHRIHNVWVSVVPYKYSVRLICLQIISQHDWTMINCGTNHPPVFFQHNSGTCNKMSGSEVTSLQIYSQMRQKLAVVLFSIHLNWDLVVSGHFANTFPEILSTLYEAKYIEKYSKWEEKGKGGKKMIANSKPNIVFT